MFITLMLSLAPFWMGSVLRGALDWMYIHVVLYLTECHRQINSFTLCRNTPHIKDDMSFKVQVDLLFATCAIKSINPPISARVKMLRCIMYGVQNQTDRKGHSRYYPEQANIILKKGYTRSIVYHIIKYSSAPPDEKNVDCVRATLLLSL